MAQTIKHRRGKLESIAGSVTPINGELIIASGSDLAVHQECLLFVGVEGNVLTPSNKILTGSATLDVTGGSYNHSIDGVPYYETDAQKLTILGKGGNTDVTLAHGQIDFKGSGIVSSSSQVSALAGINDSTLTITAGDGLKTGGTFTSNQSGDSSVTLNIDVSDFAGTGLEADGSENLRITQQNNNTILGNVSGGTASPTALTAANVRTLINVEDGATADQTKSDIDGLAITTVGTLDSGDATGIVSAASATAAGKVELATTAETTTGTDATRAVTPDGLKDGYQGSANVTTLGTIGTGTWNGTAIDKQYLDDEVLNTSLNTHSGSVIQRLGQIESNTGSYESGDISGVTAGSGLTGGGSSGALTLNIGAGNLIDVQADQVDVDLTELTDMTQTFVPGEDEFVILDGGSAQKRKLASEIFGSNAYTSTTIGTTTNALTVDDSSIQLNSGTTFNGSAARTISIKAGGVTNAMLENDGITIGTTDTSLGGSITAIVGLTDLDLAAGDRTIFDTVGANTLTVGASTTDVVIAGNLQVSGTTTYIDTTNVAIGDNILELNAAGSNDGGIYVRDAEGTSNSGSLLWNTGDDRWIGGVKGSEKILSFYNADPTTNNVQKVNSSNLLVDSAISDNGTAVTISSNLIISGLTASQLVVTNASKQLVSSTDISSLTVTLDGGQF